MSWNWKEEEEKKEYEAKGTVTISTEEYRDLIERVQELKAAGQREHDDWYKEYCRAGDLEKKVKALEEKIAEVDKKMALVNEWFSLYPANAEAFKEFKLRKIAQEEE